jgi:hypothetical protein
METGANANARRWSYLRGFAESPELLLSHVKGEGEVMRREAMRLD